MVAVSAGAKTLARLSLSDRTVARKGVGDGDDQEDVCDSKACEKPLNVASAGHSGPHLLPKVIPGVELRVCGGLGERGGDRRAVGDGPQRRRGRGRRTD